MTIAGSFELPFFFAALSDEDDTEGAEPLVLDQDNYDDDEDDAAELVSDDDEDDKEVSLEEMQAREEKDEDVEDGFGKEGDEQ